MPPGGKGWHPITLIPIIKWALAKLKKKAKKISESENHLKRKYPGERRGTMQRAGGGIVLRTLITLQVKKGGDEILSGKEFSESSIIFKPCEKSQRAKRGGECPALSALKKGFSGRPKVKGSRPI